MPVRSPGEQNRGERPEYSGDHGPMLVAVIAADAPPDREGKARENQHAGKRERPGGQLLATDDGLVCGRGHEVKRTLRGSH